MSGVTCGVTYILKALPIWGTLPWNIWCFEVSRHDTRHAARSTLTLSPQLMPDGKTWCQLILTILKWYVISACFLKYYTEKNNSRERHILSLRLAFEGGRYRAAVLVDFLILFSRYYFCRRLNSAHAYIPKSPSCPAASTTYAKMWWRDIDLFISPRYYLSTFYRYISAFIQG